MYLLSYGPPHQWPVSQSGGHRLARKLREVPDLQDLAFVEHQEEVVYFTFSEEGSSLWSQWFVAPDKADKPITGVLCDWLQDHRDLLLSGAVGPNPAERLEQVIEWFRQHFERGSYAKAN